MVELEQTPNADQSPAKTRIHRRIAKAGARGVLGLIGVGIAGVSIAAATLIPLPTVGVGPISTVVSPVAANQERICAGPVLQLGDDTGLEATTAISLGRVDVTQAATSGTPSLEDMAATENPRNSPSLRLLLPPPAPGESTGILAGSQSQAVDGADLAGFAASECAKPSAESWLVGGSTITGRTTLLSLNNPTKVTATVNLTIYSESGLVNASGTDGITVPPGGRQVLSLAGFAPGITSPVVKVQSFGGMVTASLQQSIVRTITPGGVDVVTAGTSPASVTVIPGIVIAGHDDVMLASTLEGYSDLAGALRVLVPGEGPAEISISAVQENGTSLEETSTLKVERGIVTDFPLGDFTDGTWTLTVSSDHPAVASVRTSTVSLSEVTRGDGGTPVPASDDVRATDFAWFVGAPELENRSLVSVAAGPSPMLHFVNTGSSDALISIDATQGAGTSVTVAPQMTLAVPVAADESYRLGGFDSVRVAVSYHGRGALAGFVVSPPDRGSQPITVFNQFG